MVVFRPSCLLKMKSPFPAMCSGMVASEKTCEPSSSWTIAESTKIVAETFRRECERMIQLYIGKKYVKYISGSGRSKNGENDHATLPQSLEFWM